MHININIMENYHYCSSIHQLYNYFFAEHRELLFKSIKTSEQLFIKINMFNLIYIQYFNILKSAQFSPSKQNSLFDYIFRFDFIFIVKLLASSIRGQQRSHNLRLNFVTLISNHKNIENKSVYPRIYIINFLFFLLYDLAIDY